MVNPLQNEHAKVISVQNCLVRSNGGTDSPCPINIEFKRLRRSGRQASQTKRSYDNMQGANKAKKQKLAADEPATDGLATDELATDEPTKPTTLESTDDPAIIEPNSMEPLETSREDTGRQGTDEVMVRSEVATIIEDDETTIDRAVEGSLPLITHADRITILDEYFPKSAIDSSPHTPVV